MSTLTRQEVEQIALLARLHLEPDEIERMSVELGAILEHFGALAATDTTDVPPMTHAVPMDLRLREDAVAPSLPAEVAVASAPAHDGGMFVVPAIIPGAESTEHYWSVADTRRIAAGEPDRQLAETMLGDRARRRARHVLAVDARARGRARGRPCASQAPLGPSPACRCAQGQPSPRASRPLPARSLEGWIRRTTRPWSRSCAAGAVILGKTNSTSSAWARRPRTRRTEDPNPWTRPRPGGSSRQLGRVAAGLARRASAPTPAVDPPATALCGIVGLKPTYGRLAWVVFASSLDQVGRCRWPPTRRSAGDRRARPRDATSLDAPVPTYRDALTGDVKGLRVGIPHEYYEGPLDDDVRAALDKTKAALVERGAALVDITLPNTEHALPAYYIVAPAEASSNLARYDGIRYGKAATGAKNLLALYMKSRGAGFGPEVKRRIMLGTYALRSGYYDAYYKKAQQIRTLIKRDFDKAFHHVDVILTPTTPTAAFRFGAKATPMDMYLTDVFTLSCNLAGLPGISVPCGLSSEGLPIGAQLGKPDEATVLRRAVIEAPRRRAGSARRRCVTGESRVYLRRSP